jgi:hypothetical protein
MLLVDDNASLYGLSQGEKFTMQYDPAHQSKYYCVSGFGAMCASSRFGMLYHWSTPTLLKQTAKDLIRQSSCAHYLAVDCLAIAKSCDQRRVHKHLPCGLELLAA